MSLYISKREKVVPAKPLARLRSGRRLSPGQETVQLSQLLKSSRLQAKLKVGRPNDRYEREADRVAAQVMAAPESGSVTAPVVRGITPLTVQRSEEEEAQTKSLLQRQEEEEEEVQAQLLQRQPEEEEEEEEMAQPQRLQRQEEEEDELQTKLQRQPLEEEEEMIQPKGDGRATAPVQLSAQMSSMRGSGRPMPARERAFFEPRFGADFSAVRIHDGAQAVQMARSVRARAFTVGNDLVFGAGQYAPGSERGRKLMAHELTHVIQQKGGKK